MLLNPFNPYTIQHRIKLTTTIHANMKTVNVKEAKILVNTSIHEALPISFLEALAYGTVLVSNRNPENLTSKFGIHVGDVFGDGFDKINLFVDAIKELMTDDKRRTELALSAAEYVRNTHNVEKFTKDLRDVILKETTNV